MSSVRIEDSWKQALAAEFSQPYFEGLISFVKQEKTAGKVIHPPGSLIFNAFDTTPFDQVKVVILGQDPYINHGEAMGLSFSVPKGIKIPPSLRNIYKELSTDLNIPPAPHGDLTHWAKQGVFLLNAVLTVEHKKSRSHQKKGWETFTDAVIQAISAQRTDVVFMLWGNFARNKKVLIDQEKHLILEAAHPSPLAGGAYFGSQHFSKANAYLTQQGKKSIDWKLE